MTKKAQKICGLQKIKMNIGDIKIEKNIPIPECLIHSKYGFEIMEVGDSFFVKCESDEDKRKMRTHILSVARNFRNRKKLYWKFRAINEEHGVRLWRTK